MPAAGSSGGSSGTVTGMTDQPARIVDALEDDVVDVKAAAGDTETVSAEDASAVTPGVEPTD